MKYVIINTFDQPCRRMICELVDGKYHYMAAALPGNEHLKGYAMDKQSMTTAIEDFGFNVVESKSETTFCRVRESNAKYEGGEPRNWQDHTWGWEIGDQFSLPRVVVKRAKAVA